jgi:CHASE1-domain containing sensor protein
MKSLRSRAVRLIALACGLAATLFAWHEAGRQADLEARAQFASRSNLATGVLQRRLQRYLDILYGLQAFAYHSEQFTRQGFRQYVTALQLGKRFPGVQAVEFVRRVAGPDRDHFILSLRSDPSMGPVGGRLDITPEGVRDEYWVIDFLEPLAGNEDILGLDILERPAARAAAERARDFGEPSATGRYRLAQEKGSSHGLVIYLPVFGRSATHAGFLGLVNVVLRVDDTLADALSDPLLSDRRIRIHDMGAVGAAAREPSAQTLFYGTPGPPGDDDWLHLSHSLEKPVTVAGRQWLVQYEDEPAPAPWAQPRALAVLAAGLGMTLLLYAIFRTVARARSEALGLATRATRDLSTQL